MSCVKYSKIPNIFPRELNFYWQNNSFIKLSSAIFNDNLYCRGQNLQNYQPSLYVFSPIQFYTSYFFIITHLLNIIQIYYKIKNIVVIIYMFYIITQVLNIISMYNQIIYNIFIYFLSHRQTFNFSITQCHPRSLSGS